MCGSYRSVSYTHLDVYKRQSLMRTLSKLFNLCLKWGDFFTVQHVPVSDFTSLIFSATVFM